MSQVTATSTFLKLQSTPTNELIRSGLVKRLSFRDILQNLAEQSNMTLRLSGFWEWYTHGVDVPYSLSFGYHWGWFRITFVNDLLHKGLVVITIYIWVYLSLFFKCCKRAAASLLLFGSEGRPERKFIISIIFLFDIGTEMLYEINILLRHTFILITFLIEFWP